eukprot:TRINITY_DN15922_c0_g1_i1.p1 TRINITY_DN15922_c0_g1~~TRINITY_DN15922_c0_g1_i1.p1  ORF type:complete len:1193 (+),score=339.90 TRINITY_DN15922_c0_g1_i1:98-3580(+)
MAAQTAPPRPQAARRLRAVAAALGPGGAADAAARAASAATGLPWSKVLVANRGEPACRILRALREIGVPSVAVFAEDDAQCMHVRMADEAVPLKGKGPPAYLDAAAIAAAAAVCGAQAVHPGWGFLSEDAAFARLLAARGLTFVGPLPDALECFGDKSRARALAVRCDVPVLPGTTSPSSLSDCTAFFAAQPPGSAVMLKAAEGGGGRGMRPVHSAADLPAAYESCQREAQAAFGKDSVFCELLLRRPRHIEVQCLGDGSGCATLWERDCSLQRSRQKVVEIAPCPGMSAELRQRLCGYARRLMGATSYRGLGTVEFLVTGGLGPGAVAYFLEVNPRLQVEHTVTEEISGVDLVHAQLRLAAGAPLAALGLPNDAAAAPAVCSVQCRVTMEQVGPDGSVTPVARPITAYLPPSGRGVRVDGCGYAGWSPSPRYDSLLAKLICTAPTLAQAAARCRSALREFAVAGPPTNIAHLSVALGLPAFAQNQLHTEFLADHAAAISSGARGFDAARAHPAAAGPAPQQAEAEVEVEGGVRAQLAGTVAEVSVTPGAVVRKGDPLCILMAMKMETVVAAPHAGVVERVCVSVDSDVAAGQLVAVVSPASGAAAAAGPAAASAGQGAEPWSEELQELAQRRRLVREGDAMRRAEAKKQGKLNVHERIERILDGGSFREVGATTGKFTYDPETGKMTGLVSPMAVVTGRGTIGGRPVVLGGDDFTVRGGSAEGSLGSDKRGHVEKLARELRVPVVRLIDGNSGGGSVGLYSSSDQRGRQRGFDASKGGTYVPNYPGYSAQIKLLSEIPVASILLGPVVGMGAARAVACHFSVIVKGLAQLMVAGPPVVRHATKENLTKEQLGGSAICSASGAVDNVAESEGDAYNQVRQWLSYLPSSVWELAPRITTGDPAGRADSELRSLIPRNRRRHFDVRRAINGIVDRDSFFEVGAGWARGVVTGFARLDGWSVGLIAGDGRFNGGALDAPGTWKLRRHVDLCELFHVPLLNLVDMPGFVVGSEAERTAVIRHGMGFLSAMYSSELPRFTVILRRAFGVAGQALVGSEEGRHSGTAQKVAWPSADWGSLPLEGGVEAAYGRMLRSQPDKGEKMRAEIMGAMEKIRSPFRTADGFGVEDIIDPAQTRSIACEWAALAYRKLAHGDHLRPRPGFYRP